MSNKSERFEDIDHLLGVSIVVELEMDVHIARNGDRKLRVSTTAASPVSSIVEP